MPPEPDWFSSRRTPTTSRTEADYYNANITKVKSITDLMANPRLLSFAMAAHGLDASTETPARIRQMLEGGIRDPFSPANLQTDKRYANFVTAFDFKQLAIRQLARDGAIEGDAGTLRRQVGRGVYQAERRLRQGRDRLLPGQRLQLDFDLYDLMAEQAAAEFALSYTGSTRRPRSRRLSDRCGGRRCRSRKPGEQADGQALRGLRIGLQLHRPRRTGCPASAPMRQNWLNEEGRLSGRS